ncbi:MAG: threonine synthase [Alphaproteobacteria bacterium]
MTTENTPLSYRSTRGRAPAVTFDALLLAGLAPDGGLYVPSRWPRLDLEALNGLPFADIVAEVMRPFAAQSLLGDQLNPLARRAYSHFSHPAVIPLTQLRDDQWLLELFHGPTFAFKDLAMQYLGYLIPALLEDRTITILVATSGDTGSAAIAAFANKPGLRIVVLHPEGRVSDVQRRQMTSSSADNVHNFAVNGDFDDCQALVKAAFADKELSEEHALVAVNSINWVRIVAQAAYYIAACLRLGAHDQASKGGRKVSFVVPSGNFGNAYAAYVAHRLGAPIASVGVATNRNDILARFLASGSMERRPVAPTIAPSMDIQVASNFERLLFELLGANAEQLETTLAEFADNGQFTVRAEVLARAREFFWGEAVAEAEIEAEIRYWYEAGGPLLDPHSAIGVAALRRYAASSYTNGKVSGDAGGDAGGDIGGEVMVALGCAHAAKFPATVARAVGTPPPLPPALAELDALPERFARLAANFDDLRLALDGLPSAPSSPAGSRLAAVA